MRIASVLENQIVEKRIAITPEIAKKYLALGFEISLIAKYGEHLGFKDSEYEEFGVEISSNETEILNKADIIIQLGLLSDENLSNLKEKIYLKKIEFKFQKLHSGLKKNTSALIYKTIKPFLK